MHNPKAGDGGRLKKDLIDLITSCDFSCTYVSTKDKGWDRLKRKTTLVVVAGGDGTVRQVLKRLLKRRLIDKRLTIAIVPLGTANNFAKTLHITASLPGLKQTLAKWHIKKIDIGAVGNLPEASFFLEGMGFGLMAALMETMKRIDRSAVKSADEELVFAMDQLINLAGMFEPRAGAVTIDGVRHEGHYLMMEVLNTRSVGPNLVLAPDADPTDGRLHAALVKESDRGAFVAYLHELRSGMPFGQRRNVPCEVITVYHSLSMEGDHKLLHVDDELIKVKKSRPLTVEVRAGIVDLLS